MSDQPLTPRRIFERIPEVFDGEKARGINASVQFVLTGADGGEWCVNIADGACQVTEGRTTNPRVTITTDAQVYVDLVSGKLNPMTAFMSGKVKLDGDLGLVMRLGPLFQAP
ncbi:MAG: SCP2 sterol-binding domain-containing protein [Chloroflexota bacterium]|nr:MAG: SCP2 sterol-binding domain-containing protein [Chloroflexota bacterium]